MHTSHIALGDIGFQKESLAKINDLPFLKRCCPGCEQKLASQRNHRLVRCVHAIGPEGRWYYFIRVMISRCSTQAATAQTSRMVAQNTADCHSPSCSRPMDRP